MDSFNLLAIIQAIVRWVHVFAVILWVGQTYLFHLMERKMRSTGEPGSIGKMWMLHGGGYYEVEKRHLSAAMPEELVWFKWEAATTWITGILLLGLTYHAGGFLVEPGQNFGLAAGGGFGAIVLGWAVYDVLVRSPIGRNAVLFGIVSLVLLLALHVGLLEIMSGRSAFIHVGAVIGTIMAGNVWMRILPSQKKMLAAAKAGEDLDPSISSSGPIRSRHNSLLAVPLVLVMVSNHYPTITYGSDMSTLSLGLILVAGSLAARLLLGESSTRST
jgi:uncharacterized membrane protein